MNSFLWMVVNYIVWKCVLYSEYPLSEVALYIVSMWLYDGSIENVMLFFSLSCDKLLVLKVDSTMYTTSQYSINHSVCVLRYVFSILLQRVKALSQSIHYNDPLRKYLNTIIKVFSPELQSELIIAEP